MCGIFAALTPDAPFASEALDGALTALRHRGPDGRGSCTSGSGEVVLGHARLAIIDPTGGAQPIANEDGTVRAVVNGEFYDFERIREELRGRGHHFRTGSDSEILVHLYEEHGAGCLERLRGEFAFVLWDERRRTLLAGRDRWGIKPLCYAPQGDRLLLASEAKALFAAGVPAAWDRESFFQACHFQYVLPDRTLFARVRQVPPGCYLEAREGSVAVRRYWDLDYPRLEEAAGVSDAEAIEEVRERLDEAVRLRLRADVPVACHLSGGLDSATVAALASRQMRSLDCFTVAFDAEPYDELRIAEETARHLGVALHVVRVTAADLVAALPDAVAAGEGLAINGHLPAKFVLSRAIRDAGYRVVLTGEGSDEVLAGYAHLRQDLLAVAGASGDEQTRLTGTNQVSAGIMLPYGESLRLDAVRRRLGWVPAFLAAKGTLGYRLRSVLSEEFLNEHRGYDAYERYLAAVDAPGQLHGRHPVHKSLYLWSKSALSQYILRTLGDGTEMAHSVEGRLPFLDHHFFEYVRALPIEQKIRGGVEKHVLREAMRPLLPEAVVHRQKHPFLAPPLTRDTAGLREMREELVRSGRLDAVPFFDGGKVRQWLDRLPSIAAADRSAADPVLMTLLCAALLQERFGLA